MNYLHKTIIHNHIVKREQWSYLWNVRVHANARHSCKFTMYNSCYRSMWEKQVQDWYKCVSPNYTNTDTEQAKHLKHYKPIQAHKWK